MKKLYHKNLVQFYGSSKKENMLELYFEYVNGGTLEDYLRLKKKISEK